MSTTFSFGDLVRVRGAAGVGLIAELRRGDCRVQFLREGRSVWSALRDLSRVPALECSGSLEGLVHELLRLLGATELEFSMPDAARCRLAVSHGAVVPETIDRLRERLGARLTTCAIRPQGMHRIQTILEFRL